MEVLDTEHMSDELPLTDTDDDEVFADIEDLEAVIEQEIANDGNNEDDEEKRVVGFADDTVTFGDREFVIGEPDIGVTVRILNAIGRVGVRGEKVAARLIQNPTSRAVVFGILAAMSLDDVRFLALALLQMDDTKESRRWIRDADLKIAPLVKAFFLNYAKSEDLREALANFFVGQEMLEQTLSGLGV